MLTLLAAGLIIGLLFIAHYIGIQLVFLLRRKGYSQEIRWFPYTFVHFLFGYTYFSINEHTIQAYAFDLLGGTMMLTAVGIVLYLLILLLLKRGDKDRYNKFLKTLNKLEGIE